MKQAISTPKGVPRLFNLIKVRDEPMKLAFFVKLGNTIVAKDLDQATRIAYGGNREFRRVVTLDGALFEKSGTTSGGEVSHMVVRWAHLSMLLVSQERLLLMPRRNSLQWVKD